MNTKLSESEKSWESRVASLETEVDTQRDNENKLKSLVNQARSQVNKLTTDMEITHEQLKKKELVKHHLDFTTLPLF